MRKKSVKRWIVKNLILFMTPLLIVIIVLFYVMISELTRNKIELTEQTASLYINKMDDSLNSMKRLLVSIYNDNMDVSNLRITQDKNLIAMSSVSLGRTLANNILVHNEFNGMFVAIEREDQWIFVPASNDISYLNTVKTLSELLQNEKEDINYYKWFIYPIDNTFLLLRITKNGNAYCGAWMKLEGLAEDLEKYFDNKNSLVVVYSKDGELISGKSDIKLKITELYNKNRKPSNVKIGDSIYAANHITSSISGLEFNLFIPAGLVYQKIYILRIIIILVVLGIIILAYSLWKQMEKRIVEPCLHIQHAMKNINTEEKLKPSDDYFVEYYNMVVGFDFMKSQIYNLRIESYEQQIREQKIHMQYLFAQIQPHFFLNTLNVLYSFAELERYDLIQKMVLALVRYLRYTFNNGSKLVPIANEIDYIMDFLTIQMMRYPDSFVFIKDIDNELLNTGILPFLLQTFIENSIKYGIIEGRTKQIDLNIKKEEIDGEPYVQVIISDNGLGFTSEELIILNEDSSEIDEGIYKVGIRNTRQRLKLLYKEKCNIELYNGADGGAVVKIRFPLIYI